MFDFHLGPQDPCSVTPNEKPTQSFLLKETISIVFSPELTVIILNLPVPFTLPWSYQALFKSFRLHPLVPLNTPYRSTHFIYHQPPQSVFLPAPLPPPTHHSFSLSVFFVSLADWIPAPISPSLSLSPSPRCLSSAQLPVELDAVQEQADGSVIRSASLHSLSTSPC